MKFAVVALAVILFGGAALASAQEGAVVGKPAPDFTLTDSNGKSHSLSAYKGKTVVLEWVNFGCPFVRKHYGAGNMQKLQKDYTGKGVVWLSLNSSGQGKEGFHTAAEINSLLSEKGAAPSAYLSDTNGKVGHQYGARTTPHMFVIDPKGTLVYAGGIDDKPSTDQADIPGATNYVAAALDEALAGKKVATAVTKPYGCSVKYSNAE
jgi:alkyl hydroperoxide reductase subunit AhpC